MNKIRCHDLLPGDVLIASTGAASRLVMTLLSIVSVHMTPAARPLESRTHKRLTWLRSNPDRVTWFIYTDLESYDCTVIRNGAVVLGRGEIIYEG